MNKNQRATIKLYVKLSKGLFDIYDQDNYLGTYYYASKKVSWNMLHKDEYLSKYGELVKSLIVIHS